MIELLSPAGSMDALRAAVQNGADAVYLGVGTFNARVGAKNFSMDDLTDAVRYCHIRGVKVHLTLNTLTSDREQSAVIALIRAAAIAGVDAFIVQDPGTVRLCREIAPHVAVHASTQMSIHNLDGVKAAARLGCSRVVLARELSKDEIAHICRYSPIEIEVFVHGALCMCYSGQCYFSSVVGRRSGNRGQCAQPCRLNYGYGRKENKYPLSLKDNCLISHLEELRNMGVTSLKLEGRMKRAEYVATVTSIYRKALDESAVTEEMEKKLADIFSRQGFTQGFYKGQTGAHMLGTRQDLKENKELLAEARQSYENGENARVPVTFYAMIQRGRPLQVAVEDPEGRICHAQGAVAEEAHTRSITAEEVEERLGKTGGTPYIMRQCRLSVSEGLSVSAAELNRLRREVLAELTMLRGRKPDEPLYAPLPPLEHIPQSQTPRLNVSIQKFSQLTEKLLSLSPAVLYVPLWELSSHPEALHVMPAGTELCPVLPRVLTDKDLYEVERKLKFLHSHGIRTALAGNAGHVEMLRRLGFTVRGDFGLNVFSSASLSHWKMEGLESCTLSFEATLSQIRDLKKPLNCEILIYGRLPLMLTENCIIKNRAGVCNCQSAGQKLVDRKGEEFPLLPDPGTCRTVIYNGKKLYLLDKRRELAPLDLWAVRLQFTTETAHDVDRVLGQYLSCAPLDGTEYTRGLYLRGVE
ncbi:MAG: U32 family peptidase [Oscillospiraceae bacterium]|nr:U32 family peptidase [Oscillospiraceae bacterium]